jgi:hypothetical protein
VLRRNQEASQEVRSRLPMSADPDDRDQGREEVLGKLRHLFTTGSGPGTDVDAREVLGAFLDQIDTIWDDRWCKAATDAEGYQWEAMKLRERAEAAEAGKREAEERARKLEEERDRWFTAHNERWAGWQKTLSEVAALKADGQFWHRETLKLQGQVFESGEREAVLKADVERLHAHGRPADVAMFDAMQAEAARLRARVAELTAERDDWRQKAEERADRHIEAERRVEELERTLAEDAAGCSVAELLRTAGNLLHNYGGGPVEERCYLAADAIEAALQPREVKP